MAPCPVPAVPTLLVMTFLTPYTFLWDLPMLLVTVAGLAVFGVSIAHMRRKNVGVLRWSGLCMVALASGLWSAAFLYGCAVEPQLITVTTIRIQADIRQPLRIALLSDLHMGAYKGADYLQRVVQRTNALVPDIVLLAGDYVLGDTPADQAAAALAPLKELHPAAGTYGVLGNHDHGLFRAFGGLHTPVHDPSGTLAKALEQAGVTVLDNANEIVTLGTDKLAIAGIEDRWMPDSDVRGALANIPKGIPIILIAHNPDVVLDPQSGSASIIVAGHTHGGQIRLPGLGPVPRLPTRLGRVFDQGLFRIHNNTDLVITRGVGESGPRMRLFAPPEILLLELEPKEATAI